MQIENFRVPLRMNFNPLNSAALPATPERLLSRSLRLGMSRQAFQQNQLQFSAAAREQITQGGRTALLRDVSNRLGGLMSSLALPSLLSSSVRVVMPGVEGAAIPRTSAIGSPTLNLGTATVSSPAPTPGPTPVVTPPAPTTIDPSGLLRDQPFATAITQGNLRFDAEVNGNPTGVNVAVDPNTDSLEDVLARIAQTTGASASYDAATQSFSLAGAFQGSGFTLDTAGSTSNFFAVMTSAERTTRFDAVAGATVEATKNQTAYNDLQIRFQGQTLATITGLDVGKGLKQASATDRATTLAADINAQLAGTGITASATGGKLSFSAVDSSGAAIADLEFSEVTPVSAPTNGGKKSGKGGKGGGGGNVDYLSLGIDDNATRLSVTIGGKPALKPPVVVPPPPPPPPPSGELLGPGAKLSELAGQLGLTSANGEFTFSINGTRLSFSEDETLNDVLAGINRSQAGVTASYDPKSRNIVVTSQTASASPILTDDIAGNLLGSLGLTLDRASFSAGAVAARPAETATVTSLSAEGVAALEKLGAAIGETLDLVDTALEGGYKDDALLRDLKDALGGLFAAGGEGEFSSLADLGFSVGENGVSFDPGRLAGLSGEQLEAADAFLGAFVADQVAPLLRSATRAIGDAEAQAPVTERLARQAVAVSAELSRLQQRQQMLLFQQVSFDKSRESLERQDEGLKATQGRLNAKPEAEKSDEAEEFPPDLLAERLDPPPTPPTAPPATGGFPQAPVAPGLGSFGLSG